MRAIVIGAGLIGLASAWALRQHGFDVTILDRREGPALETSFANGGLLTPSMSDPWNAPGSWRTLLSSFARSDAPLQLRLNALPSLGLWGLRFLANSAPARYEANMRCNLALALYSLTQTARLQEEAALSWTPSRNGTLRIFRDAEGLALTSQHAASLSSHILHKLLSPAELAVLEPALAPICSQLVGAIHYPNDESGDAFTFCESLARRLSESDVSLRFGYAVRTLNRRGDRIVSVTAGEDEIEGDAFVLAAGSYTEPLLRSLGFYLPVRPAKGYSISIDIDPNMPALRTPVVDDALHAVVTPIGNVLRAAGTAEFAGFDLALRPERIRNLSELVQRILPLANLRFEHAHGWCGLRPMSCDGVPIIGATPLTNLWINTGHGHLGWTMAAGSGQLLADVMTNAAPAIDPAPYALSRFN